MKSASVRLLGAIAGLAIAAGGCRQQVDLDAAVAQASRRQIAAAKDRVYPALVFVKPIRETYDGGQRQREEIYGSGVIIDPAGYVVTNSHVAEKAVRVHCVLGDREQVPAVVVGIDVETDLALLKLQLPPQRALPSADFADSDQVESGQVVMALGAPFGFTRSISRGIVSNTTRYLGFSSQHQVNLFFQTDAAINPGNSGGPLVDTAGRIVGINTLGTSTGGIGFAIPSNIVQDVITRLRRRADATDPSQWPVKVERAQTGLQLQALRDFNSNTFTEAESGVLIRSVEPESPADKAGIRSGDILLSVGGRPISGLYVEDLPAVRVLLADLPAGAAIDVVVLRRTTGPSAASDPETLTLSMTPLSRGKLEGEDFDCLRWNMTLKEITRLSSPKLHALHPGGGVFVQGIRGSGNANDAGLRPDDVVTQIGETTIATLEDARQAYQALTGPDGPADRKVLVVVRRGRFVHWMVLDWTRDYLQED